MSTLTRRGLLGSLAALVGLGAAKPLAAKPPFPLYKDWAADHATSGAQFQMLPLSSDVFRKGDRITIGSVYNVPTPYRFKAMQGAEFSSDNARQLDAYMRLQQAHFNRVSR